MPVFSKYLTGCHGGSFKILEQLTEHQSAAVSSVREGERFNRLRCSNTAREQKRFFQAFLLDTGKQKELLT